MLLASPLPDELYNSYYGRLCDLNGIFKGQRREWLNALFVRYVKSDSNQTGGPALLELLSHASSMSVQDFVQRHTMLPYRRSIVRKQDQLAHGDPKGQHVLRFGAPWMPRKDAYFCEQCVDDDSQAFGMSYWHRRHQLPGVFVCQFHKRALKYTTAKDAFSQAPSLFLNNCMRINDHWALSSHASPHVKCFISLSEAFLATTQPFASRPIKSLLRARSIELGLALPSIGSRQVRERVIELFPPQWLECIIPGMVSKTKRGASFGFFDRALRQGAGHATLPYLLAFGALFESSEEAERSLHLSQKPEALAALLSKDSGSGNLSGHTKEAPISDNLTRRRNTEQTGRQGERVSRAALMNDCTFSLTSRLRKKNMREATRNFFLRKLPLEESANLAGIKTSLLELFVRDAASDILPDLKRIILGEKTFQTLNASPHELGHARPSNERRTKASFQPDPTKQEI